MAYFKEMPDQNMRPKPAIPKIHQYLKKKGVFNVKTSSLKITKLLILNQNSAFRFCRTG
jgi:hypothetical protein